ncbi:unnamed protein product [Ilex paraguariensis]|uniref:Ubiquitin-like domain-containing protein n=1 Tax=Ilex paraguariensis TaxID=185542 RepID=A0ABC8SYZ4_9AQUA
MAVSSALGFIFLEGLLAISLTSSRIYVVVRDVHLPVSFIKKYLVRKLELDTEDEVEITLRGQPLVPTLQLNKLIEVWSQTASTSERMRAYVGSSAKDFVMVLSYGRKA